LTTSLTATSPGPRASALPRALVKMSAQAQRQLWGIRLTRLYAIGIGVSYSVLVLTAPLDAGLVPRLWLKCLTLASWVSGVGALSLARDLVERDVTQGLAALARLRGFGTRALERARVAAGAIKLSTTVAIPGLLVSLSALLRFRSAAAALTSLGLCLFTLAYAALLGTTLAALARACSRALPGRGRLLLLLVALGPWLLAAGISIPLPSIPGAFGWLLSRLAEVAR
jgi:hypothetical protein